MSLEINVSVVPPSEPIVRFPTTLDHPDPYYTESPVYDSELELYYYEEEIPKYLLGAHRQSKGYHYQPNYKPLFNLLFDNISQEMEQLLEAFAQHQLEQQQALSELTAALATLMQQVTNMAGVTSAPRTPSYRNPIPPPHSFDGKGDGTEARHFLASFIN